MKKRFDLAIIGAGPAGVAAAIRASKLGLSVLVLDEQPAPGGQIWRAVEARKNSAVADVLGDEYRKGASYIAEFRRSGVTYEPNSRVWQIEPGWEVFSTRDGVARSHDANRILVATGAQERPAPFQGWTTPGVMTVGAAQILLKSSGEVPDSPVWIAGSGPLPLLYIAQLLRAGGSVAGWLDTTPPGAFRRTVPHLLEALTGWKDLVKGLRWMNELRTAGVKIEKGVSTVRAVAGLDGHLAHVEYGMASGTTRKVLAQLLLVHEGVVPSIHVAQVIGCKHRWHPTQHCLVPETNEWGKTTSPGIFVAGDGAGIGGAAAAVTKGELAAIGIAKDLDLLTDEAAVSLSVPLRKSLKKQLATRPMLDSRYTLRQEVTSPADETIVCRCEELRAQEVREAAMSGTTSPDRIKSLIRAGMGPCQGRQCGYTVSNLIAATQHKPVREVGFYRVRPPLKPLTLDELASLDISENSKTSV
ncbi:FAD/NAD(P)-dependent oxidoreductase [Paraburkholderia phytofirmans]|uniref:BFD domain protein (2Fe-2S)-binding domain protein n=1 Tax=Paraburkholderia phytofirmans (strain DSM 17436 / LMG 22146 / PsJN) TaxID=398527 RepID=B2TB94_PARPJ|nr:NAD(P)/FAD-dependent oxidoreductase [Paraburkholderia phytofirmans]ACD20836.1 BFD domain protein (2Fe-2S)-binding domain protein [Paraburkholderia phytofirmans PsJN]